MALDRGVMVERWWWWEELGVVTVSFPSYDGLFLAVSLKAPPILYDGSGVDKLLGFHSIAFLVNPLLQGGSERVFFFFFFPFRLPGERSRSKHQLFSVASG